MLDICKKSWMKSQKLLDESILDATSKTWGIRAVAPRYIYIFHILRESSRGSMQLL